MKTTTTDGSTINIGFVKPSANEAGIIKANVVGIDKANGLAATGSKMVRYKSVNGTVTIGTAANLLAESADTGIDTATFAFAVVNGQVAIQVTGVASHTIVWNADVVITQAS